MSGQNNVRGGHTVFGNWLFNRSNPTTHVTTFLDRDALSQQLRSALATRKHVVIFGTSKRGKSTIVRNVFDAKSAVTITGFPDIKFADIFRTYLMTLGCSVTVESTRKKSIGSKAEIKFPWPPLLPSASLEGQYEGAVTTHNFTADINSANDICYLLRQMHSITPLVIDHFEQIGRSQRALLIDALPMMYEAGIPQIVLVSSTTELPFDFNEKNHLGSCIVAVEVPALSRAESDLLIDRYAAHIGRPAPQIAKEILYSTFDGSIGPILDACRLVAEHDLTADDQIRSAIHDQTSRAYLAFLSALAEKAWTVSVTVRPPVATAVPPDSTQQPAPDAPGDVVPIDPTLAGDGVFDRLRQTVASIAEDETEIPASVRPLFDLATAFAKQVLTHDTNAEPARFVAFALDHFLESPLKLTNWTYAPAEGQSAEINLGALLCAFLIESDLAKPVVLTQKTVEAYLNDSGYRPDDDFAPTFTKMMKRLRRLRRRLRIDPSLFPVSDDLKSCTLWDERSLNVFGDVRPQVKVLLADTLDGDDDD